MFGVGYMVLSQIRYGILIAMGVTFCGALTKFFILRRLDRLHHETQPDQF
jgi:hypothetical protein